MSETLQWGAAETSERLDELMQKFVDLGFVERYLATIDDRIAFESRSTTVPNNNVDWLNAAKRAELTLFPFEALYHGCERKLYIWKYDEQGHFLPAGGVIVATGISDVWTPRRHFMSCDITPIFEAADELRQAKLFPNYV